MIKKARGTAPVGLRHEEEDEAEEEEVVVVVEEEGQRRRPGRRESISAGSPWRERDVARRVGHG